MIINEEDFESEDIKLGSNYLRGRDRSQDFYRAYFQVVKRGNTYLLTGNPIQQEYN